MDQNDLDPIRNDIKTHWFESERCYNAGNFFEARKHRTIVDDLRAKLRQAGIMDRSQGPSTIEQGRKLLRTVDFPDALVRINPADLIRD